MKLGCYQVAVGVYATKPNTVLCGAVHSFGVFRRGVITMDEVEIAVLGDARDQRVLLLEVYAVPAHVWDL